MLQTKLELSIFNSSLKDSDPFPKLCSENTYSLDIQKISGQVGLSSVSTSM